MPPRSRYEFLVEINGGDPPAGGAPRGFGYVLQYPQPTGNDGYGRPRGGYWN